MVRDLDFDLGLVILHTVMHHSSTSTYTPNFIEIEQTFCGRTDVRTQWFGMHVLTDGRTFETGFIRSTLLKGRPKNWDRPSNGQKKSKVNG